MLNRYRLLAIAFALLIGGLCGWWLVAASAAKDDIAAFARLLKDEGWRAEPGATSISGMPMRLNYNFEQPSLATQRGDWRWAADEAHIRRLLYRSNVFQIGMPGADRLETPLGGFDLGAKSAAASLRFGGGGAESDDWLSRLSIVLTGLTADGATVERFEAHLGLMKPATPPRRKIFAKLKGLKIGGAAATNLTLSGEVLFAKPLSRAEQGAPQPILIETIPADATTGQGLTLRFKSKDGGAAELALSARFARDPDSDVLLGWRGQAAFETDEGPAVISQLGAMGILDTASQAALKARLAASGRLAGVLKIDGDKVEVHDIAPEPIVIRAR